MSFLSTLLSKGYFPKELPPPFGTSSLAWYVRTNLGNLPPQFPSPPTGKLVRHNLARVGTLRRVLSLPHPQHQFLLALALDDNFVELFSKAATSPLSASKPRFSTFSRRAISPQMHHSALAERRALTRAGGRYMLSCDISRFYQSIYTHSLPWALHTKPVAKAKRQDLTLIGNLLDKRIREAQDGQTLGIPIGPDSSLLIAELLLADIDSAIGPTSVKGFRWYDDYELVFNSLGEAEQAQALLQSMLADYELELNPAKCSITQLPVSLDHPWSYDLSHTVFRNSWQQRSDILRLFNRAFELAPLFPHDPVLRYAVQLLYKADLVQESMDLVTALLVQCIIAEPGVLPQALALLCFCDLKLLSIDFDEVAACLNEVIRHHAPRDEASEAAWAVWGCIALNLQISPESARALSHMMDDVVAILTLDAKRRGLIQKWQPFKRWSEFMTSEAFYSEHWLLSYESMVHGWATNEEKKKCATDPVISELLRSNVSFYNPQRPRSATVQHVKGTPPWLQGIVGY